MYLAAASGEDLATTSDIVTDALTAFGLTAADSGHFADVLAAASSNANTNVSMMGETFKYCAPVAGALGFSVEDTAEAIGLMGNAGIKASQAGTSMRSIMTNLTGDVKLSGAAIGDVTIATTNADGSMRSLSAILADCRMAFGGMTEAEKANNAETLVGKNAMSGFLALMNAAPEDIAKVSGAVNNCKDAAKNMADTMQDNLEGQLTILKSQLQELAISFGDLLMPAVRSIVSGKDAAKNMADTMQDNLEGQLTILKSQLQELAISFGDLLMPAVRSIVSGLQGMVNVLNAMPDGVKRVIMIGHAGRGETCDHDRCTSGCGSGSCADHHRQDPFGHWNDYDMGTEACRCDQYGEGCFCSTECHDDGEPYCNCDSCHCSFSGGVYLSLEYE